MLINLAHKSSDRTLAVETDNDDPDQVIEDIEYDGDESVIAPFLLEVEDGKYGYYGHIFRLSGATNLDLGKVVYDLKEFEVLSIEPEVKARTLPPRAVS